jgi:hypothetical protein
MKLDIKLLLMALKLLKDKRMKDPQKDMNILIVP